MTDVLPAWQPPGRDARSAALLLQCIDYISDTLLITEAGPIDAPGPRVVFVNQAFERMTGYRADEILGRAPRFLQGPNTSRDELQRVKESLARPLPVRAEFINYRKNGDEFTVEMDVVPIFDDGGRLTHWVSIQRDVTARKRAEADALVREAQHHESLGTLSAGIAHDFNNIIAAILGNVESGTLDMQIGQMPHASLAQIRRAALRARGVVGKILAYARRRSDIAVPLALAPVVLEATDLLRAILPAGATLEVSCPDEPVWIRGDANQLCQVLLNLGVNAVQALPGGVGTVRVRLEARRDAHELAAATSGGVASIEIVDTGRGMDAATRARIFEPYFTTKADSQGTGLGLAVVGGIVAAHDGSIEVRSEVGRGTRITLSLPLVARVADVAAVPEPLPVPAAPIGAGEHVLVVDDDEVVVMMLEGMLTRWGFRVTTIQDPLQALARVKESPAEFDAVVTDLNMPQVSGLELARELLAVRPELPVILGSGTVTEEVAAEAAEVGIVAVFPKEFAVEQLGGLLTRSLAATAPAIASDEAEADPGASGSQRGTVRMYGFLSNHRDDLVARCKAKVAQRPQRGATEAQLANGIPLFLDQLVRTLEAEERGGDDAGLSISGPSGGEGATPDSEIGVGATAHGKQLLALDYSVDQVVHDYGDLCQAITDLAVELDAPFSIESYRTLNRCLDNAIAGAVTEFAAQRDARVQTARAGEENQRLGFMAHELRNYLNVAMLAIAALENGRLSITGSTGTVLKRNLKQLNQLIEDTLAEVRKEGAAPVATQAFSLAAFIADAAQVAKLYAEQTGCTLRVLPVDPGLLVSGHREPLLAALNNLLQNAFKYTRPDTEVTLSARAGRTDWVLIAVRDHCGGLPPGAERLFEPFVQGSDDKRGLGLGLAIAARSVEASGGRIGVQDLPGLGCAFTIELPVG